MENEIQKLQNESLGLVFVIEEQGAEIRFLFAIQMILIITAIIEQEMFLFKNKIKVHTPNRCRKLRIDDETSTFPRALQRQVGNLHSQIATLQDRLPDPP